MTQAFEQARVSRKNVGESVLAPTIYVPQNVR